MSFLLLAFFSVLVAAQTAFAKGPFFLKVNDVQHVIGNDLWNITIGQQYGTKLFYKDRDIVGDAVGHYVSYNGAASDLNWTTAGIHEQTDTYLDVVFNAKEGDFHWVIYPDLEGAYQYFVNKALPILGEFRTLFRLDNGTFTRGKTSILDKELPLLSDIDAATNVQDETWQRADGTYITKYDFSCFIREQEYYGVYGTGFGSWYIYAGKDDYNGDHLKQELLVHRESKTGDAVMLNMIHGTHFQAASSNAFEVGKTWGPWLWYLNEGALEDVSSRAEKENQDYPYQWFKDDKYQSRGSVSGTLQLSDGRSAAGAAVFLGNNNPNETTLDMGSKYYYTSIASESGTFEFENVRSGDYAFQAWSNGAPIGDVSTTFLKNDVHVTDGQDTSLGQLQWQTQGRRSIFKIGEMDRKSLGFEYGGAPYQHGLVENCPANIIYKIGQGGDYSKLSDWCYGQSAIGNWTIVFDIEAGDVPKVSEKANAVLSVSLAGYSQGVSSDILSNDKIIGNLTSTSLLNDPSMYRSATTAGEWRYFEFELPNGLLKAGTNEVTFQVTKTSRWRGFMWDSIMLEWIE